MLYITIIQVVIAVAQEQQTVTILEILSARAAVVVRAWEIERPIN